MVNNELMDIKTFVTLLLDILKQRGNYEIWLSKDDEGNVFLRMSKNTAVSLAIDDEQRRIILFPSWYIPNLNNHIENH